MAVIIDGKALAKKIRSNLKVECDELKKEGITPKLAVIMVGDNPASKVYVRNKSKACNEVGIEYQEYLLDEKTRQEELIDLIKTLNKDETVNGILLQSPVPEHLNINQAFKAITRIQWQHNTLNDSRCYRHSYRSIPKIQGYNIGNRNTHS